MDPKQLANVLIKVLGLSLIVHEVPSFIVAILGGFDSMRFTSMMSAHGWLWVLVLNLVPVALGIFLVIRSRWVTEILFKNEAD